MVEAGVARGGRSHGERLQDLRPRVERGDLVVPVAQRRKVIPGRIGRLLVTP